MTSQTEQIEAARQRAQIPNPWQVEFVTWSNKSLASLAADPVVHEAIRAFATWELSYRMAFDQDVAEPSPPVNQKQGTFSERLEAHRREAMKQTTGTSV